MVSRSSDQLWSQRQSIRRLRLLVTVLAGICAIAVVVTSTLGQLPSQLRIGGPFAAVVALLAVLAPQLEQRLKQAQETLSAKDRELDHDIKLVAQRRRPELLRVVRHFWVETELVGSLQELARIELGLAERPAAVDYALRALLHRPDEPDRPLERGQPIEDIYRQLGQQLLILGSPGAGKTTLLLELTRQLLDKAEATPLEPMPVVFQLSTWAREKPSLSIWLVDELQKRYGVSRPLGEFWVDTEQVIPLLDGLDEVVPEHRDACLAAINDFHNANGLLPLLVSSRTAEYEALQSKLQLRGAIVIQSLTRSEVDRYLRAAGRPLAGVRAIVRDDEQLRELLTTPLFLSIVALAYRGKPATAARASGTLEDRRRRVLADYVDAMFNRPRGGQVRYSRQQTEAWLAWLAGAMRAHGESLFYLDWLQPDWLPTPAQRRVVTIGTALVAGLAGWVGVLLGPGVAVLALTADLRYVPAVTANWLPIDLTLGLIVGALVGMAAYQPTIAPTDQLRWSWIALRRKFSRWLVVGGIGIGLAVALFFMLPPVWYYVIYGSYLPPSWYLLQLGQFGLVSVVIFALPAGLLCGLLGGLVTGSYISPSVPGDAVRRSKRNALVSGLSVGFLFGMVFFGLSALVFGPFFDWILRWSRSIIELGGDPIVQSVFFALEYPGWFIQFWGLWFGVSTGLTVGLLVGLQRGGGAYLRHRVLFRLLVRNRAISRDYVAFLDHSTTLILLRRRGGGYEFIHRLLLDYFASLKASPRAVDVTRADA